MFKYKIQAIRYLTFLGFCLNASVLLKIISNQPKPNDLIDFRGDAFDARFKQLDFYFCNDGFLDLGLVFIVFTCFNTSYYIGKYHKGLLRYILLTYTLSIAIIGAYASCLLFAGENSIPQLILSILIGTHWVAIEAYALKPFDVFVRENIALTCLTLPSHPSTHNPHLGGTHTRMFFDRASCWPCACHHVVACGNGCCGIVGLDLGWAL